jgi:hypothetical protein
MTIHQLGGRRGGCPGLGESAVRAESNGVTLAIATATIG